MLLRQLHRLFQVRPGEWQLVLLMQLQLFLIICVLLITKPIAGAWFIRAFGAEALAFVFIGTAVLAAIVSRTYARARRKFSALSLNLGSLGGSMLSLLILVGLHRLPGTDAFVAAGLYLWMAIYGLLAASQFWMLANFAFDIRQAKRLFGFIGAGGILGGIAGGYLTSLLSQPLGSDPLLVLAAVLLLPCMAISIFVWQRYIGMERSKKPAPTRERQPKGAWQKISSSRHLKLICSIIFLSVTTAKLVDYQFSALAADRYQDADRLAAFFGFWLSSFNVIAFVLQLFLTQRVLKWFGVSGTLLFLPLGIGLGALFMLMSPGLWAAVLSRGADGSFKQSFNRAGTELLFLPLSADLKQQVKTYIDVFVDSLAGGIGGLLLLLLTDLLGFRAADISWVVLALVLGWMVCVVLIREEYMDAFRAQLSDLKPRRRSPYLRSYHKQLLQSMLFNLKQSKDDEKPDTLLFVLDRAGHLDDRRFDRPIEELLNHRSAAVRLRAIRALYYNSDPDLQKAVVSRLDDEAEEVRQAAYEMLLNQEITNQSKGRFDPALQAKIEARLDDPDPRKAGPALVALVAETAGNQELRKRWQVRKRLQSRLDKLPALPEEERELWKLQLVRAAGRSSMPLANDILRRGLNAKKSEVVEQAIIAAGENQQVEWVPKLIARATYKPYRNLALASLSQYYEKLAPIIRKRLQPLQFSREELLVVVRVLARIELPSSVELLLELMQRVRPDDLQLRLDGLRALRTLHQASNRLRIDKPTAYQLAMGETKTLTAQLQLAQALDSLAIQLPGRDELTSHQQLSELLVHRITGTLDRLFIALSLQYPPRDMDAAFQGMLHEDRAQRLRAIEYLDNLLDSVFKRQLLPSLERYHQRLDGTPPIHLDSIDGLLETERKQLKRILRCSDPRLKSTVLAHIAAIGDSSYLPIVEPQLQNRNKELARQAQQVLDRLRDKAAAEEE